MQLSVIVTTYNRPKALERVIVGLQYQTRLPDEVIIADDGSGRETAELVQRLATSGPFPLHHVRHADKGFRAAAIRNKAIKKATGKYILSLDGDCIPERHFIADHEYLAEDGFFYQGRRMLVSKGLSTEFTYRKTNSALKKLRLLMSGQIGNPHHLMRLTHWPPRISTSTVGIMSCNMGFWKNDLLSVNGFNQDFAGWGREDSELAVRLFKFGLKRKSHPFMAICFHLWHPQNDRRHLPDNNELLAAAQNSQQYICSNGIDRLKP